MTYEYKLHPGNRAAKNSAQVALEALADEIDALREQADRTIDALTASRARADERESTRAAVREELRRSRDRRLA